MGESRISTNGLTLNVMVEGEGPAVVLLHGFPDSWAMWRNQIPALLEAGFRVVAPDLRGFGESDRPASVEEYSIFNSIADVCGIMDVLGIERAPVVGHDYGAGIAWMMATAEAARVEKLVVVSVGHPGAITRPSLPQMRRSWYSLFFQFEGIAESLLERDDYQLLRDWCGASPDVERQVAGMRRPGALTAGLSWYRANMRPEIWGADIPFPPVAAPVLATWGTEDPYLGEEQVTGSVAYCAGTWRYERFEGAGHWIPLDEPERFNALLIEYLRETTA